MADLVAGPVDAAPLSCEKDFLRSIADGLESGAIDVQVL